MGFEAAPDCLGGCEVEVYWLDDDGCGGVWEKATFAPTVGGEEVRRGWATLLYENTDLDPGQTRTLALTLALPHP